jgi:hypothetical protein
VIARLRRNPIILAFVALVLLGILAFGWWTISPLFIRTTLVEGDDLAIPAAAMQSDMAASGQGDMAISNIKSDTILATGNFDRKDDVHYANGQALIVKQVDGTHTLRLQDLDAANGPDLYIYLSEHPDPANSEQLHEGEDHNLGNLKATTGSFNYAIDPSVDLSKVKSVVIYCRAFSVIFSVAALQAN